MSAVPLRNVARYEFLTSEDVLQEKDMLEKAATIKRFEYSPLCVESKKQTDIAEKEYQILDKFFSCNKENKNVIKSSCLITGKEKL